MFNRCWFDETKCAKGLKALDNYKKDWDDRLACWRSQPLHNWASHGADAFRTLATGLPLIENKRTLIDEQNDAARAMEFRANRFSPTR